mgnify:FL=1
MITGIKTLDNLAVKNKRVLIRVDINSDIRNGKLIPSERLTAPLETIKELQKKEAKIVLLAHQGRPGSKDFTSLRQHANFLKKKIAHFECIPDVTGMRAIERIIALKSGHVLLLDNVRFIKDELNYKLHTPNELLDRIAPLIDLYVNDAFSASHRHQASITGFPQRIEGAMGRVFERELRALQKINMRNALLVLGGSKPEDNIELLKKTKGKILASGLFGPFCLMALGKNLGLQNTIMKKELTQYGSLIRTHRAKLIIPHDLAIEHKGKRHDLRIDEFPKNAEILDLGIRTIEAYGKEIMGAKTIFFKGLAGLCNKPEFSIGTHALLIALSESNAFTLVSGGHTLTMIEKFNIPKKKFGYVSLSGGSLIHYLANGTLPGIEALKQ